MTRRPPKPDRYDEGGIIGGRTPHTPPTADDLGPLFRASDPETSKEGARQIIPRRGNQWGEILVAFLVREGPSYGLTAREAGRSVPRSLCPWKRVSELAALELLHDTGARRRDDSGSPQTVYRLTPRGRAVALGLASPEAMGDNTLAPPDDPGRDHAEQENDAR